MTFSVSLKKKPPFISSFSQPLDFTDEQILRLIGATGDQQIISREFINGEHHILTRNENGEHIITRIVTVCELLGNVIHKKNQFRGFFLLLDIHFA